ncbi:hypothetical protein M0804_010168 [Polistes exclamans]|nr:hypothetical protein M0804_010168 [Polistes exclamans]
MLLAWRDKRTATLLSNWHNAGMITTNRFIRGSTNEVIQKPSVAVGYTKSMGGVDLADQYAFRCSNIIKNKGEEKVCNGKVEFKQCSIFDLGYKIMVKCEQCEPRYILLCQQTGKMY